MTAPSLRIGHGFDAHRLVAGRPLILGGVRIEHSLGLQGHSDGDVLSHAVTDALLGAMSLGDLGRHFPSSDERWRDANSLEFIRHAVRLLGEKEARPIQVDCTLVLESPRVEPHVPQICARLAEALGIPPERVSVKATTTDGMGFTGRGEGAAAWAVAVVSAEGN